MYTGQEKELKEKVTNHSDEAKPIRDLSNEVSDLRNHLIDKYSVEEILRIFKGVKDLINKEKQETIQQLNERQMVLEKDLKMLQS